MLNLVLKDVRIQKNFIPVYIVTIILYWILNVPLVFLGFIYSIAFILNAYSYDEKNNVHLLLNSMPYTRKEIVSAKYIGAFLFTALYAVFIFVGDFIVNKAETGFPWKEMLLMIGLVMVVTALIFPFIYQFKMQHLMIASAVLTAVYFLAINSFYRHLHDSIRELMRKLMNLPDLSFYLFMVAFVIVLYLGSWLLSIRIYERKDF